MHSFKILTLALVAALAGVQLGCASSPGQRATGQVIDDAAVTARVKTALAKEASMGTAWNVNVDTYRGVVQLSGFVETAEAARLAETIARSVKGVQSVKNDIRVNPAR